MLYIISFSGVCRYRARQIGNLGMTYFLGKPHASYTVNLMETFEKGQWPTCRQLSAAGPSHAQHIVSNLESQCLISPVYCLDLWVTNIIGTRGLHQSQVNILCTEDDNSVFLLHAYFVSSPVLSVLCGLF